MEDMNSFRQRMKERKESNRQQDYQTDIPHSEYNKIIMLCHRYFQAFIEGFEGQPMMVKRRNRLFQAIELLGRFRKDLPSVEEYFGERSIGIFDGTIAEFEALEYVNVIQTKVMEMNDPKVDIGTLDEEVLEEKEEAYEEMR